MGDEEYRILDPLGRKEAMYVLLKIADNPGESKKTIMRADNGNESTRFTRMKEFEADGLITTTSGNKYNVKGVSLTEKGERIVEHLREIVGILKE